MTWLSTTAVFAATFLLMEAVAALTHRYVMHGLLWILHEDHHVQRKRVFQKNDLFALIFAVPSWLLIMFGMMAGPGDVRTPIGVGILAYGVAYTLVHEMIIHRRMPWAPQLNHWYFRAVRRGHQVHHRCATQHGCENFGMLWVPLTFFREMRAREVTHNQSKVHET